MVCAPNTCDYDMCPPKLGKCNNSYSVTNSQCKFDSGNYTGILSYPYAVSTEYCQVSSGGCVGGACGDDVTESFLKSWGVTGVAAVNPAIFGLDEERVNGAGWGQSCTHNSNICYYVSGTNGGAANVMITDRCAGYCSFNSKTNECDPDGDLWLDCGVCVQTTQNAANIHPNCPCLGTDGDMYQSCCGQEPYCKLPLTGTCDWCSGNNHPHFDLDLDTFNHVCGTDAPSGHCILKEILPYKCSKSVS